jgi:hypothetical protein
MEAARISIICCRAKTSNSGMDGRLMDLSVVLLLVEDEDEYDPPVDTLTQRS